MADFSYVQESLIASMTNDSEDSCSICLEPFNLHDPSTVTNCKHEYHLHCILEWSQRSKECPICWQSLALKDPASQELLAAVTVERNAGRRNTRTNISTYPPLYQESDSEYVSRWTDDPDFNERIMQHLAAMMSQARQGHENERQVPSRVSDSTLHPNTPEEWSSANGSSGCSSPTASISSVDAQPALSPSPSFISFGSVPKIDTRCHSRSLPSQSSDSTQRQRSSELLAFSESIKSRLSATSARYKDSISKGTQGFREKFLPCNISVKELSTGVQREMNAGIAGVARMMERLDLSFKRNLRAGEGCTCSGEASNFFSKGKGVLDDIIANSCENYVVTDKETVSQEKSSGHLLHRKP